MKEGDGVFIDDSMLDIEPGLVVREKATGLFWKVTLYNLATGQIEIMYEEHDGEQPRIRTMQSYLSADGFWKLYEKA